MTRERNHVKKILLTLKTEQSLSVLNPFGLKTLLFRPTQRKRYNGITVFLRKTNVKHM